MNLFDFFRGRQKQSSASVAKERLQIIVAHERGQRTTPDYLPALQKELVEVKGYSSIRVNRQYRLVFRWTEGKAEDLYLSPHKYTQHK